MRIGIFGDLPMRIGIYAMGFVAKEKMHLSPAVIGAPWMPRAAHFEPRALCSSTCLASPWTPRAAHFEPRALCSLELLGVPLDAARRSLRATCPLQPRAARRPLDAASRLLRAARPLQPKAVRCPLGRRAPLTSSRAPFAAANCSAPPWTPRAAHFEPRALCSLELLGVRLDAARRSLRAARPLQPQAARHPLGHRAPLTSSHALCAASSCSASAWTPRAAHFEPRFLQPRAARHPLGRHAPLTSGHAPFAASRCSSSPWTPRAARVEPRALCSLELLGSPLDAARRSLQAARPLQPRAARRPLGCLAPLTSSRALCSASNCSASVWMLRAAGSRERADGAETRIFDRTVRIAAAIGCCAPH